MTRAAFIAPLPLPRPIVTRRGQRPPRPAQNPRGAARRPRATLDDALATLRRLDGAAGSVRGKGAAFLVGTGPGDPGMLTLRAVEVMRAADVVLYDRLVSGEVLAFVGAGAELVCVGKGRGVGTGSQGGIQERMAEEVAKGKLVVRLKGGDPFVFGRGGEELQYLHDVCGVNAAVVPGVTAASGIAAGLGIPLTHRGVADSVRFLTGHLGAEADMELGGIADRTTLVVYMALQELPRVLGALCARGLRSDVAAVAVERGTTPQQRVVWGSAGGLDAGVREHGLQSPTLVIIGDVVRLAHGWRAWMQEQQSCSEGTVPTRG